MNYQMDQRLRKRIVTEMRVAKLVSFWEAAQMVRVISDHGTVENRVCGSYSNTFPAGGDFYVGVFTNYCWRKRK